jgi:NADH dehydrogenase/NADH:ubiquinone oxidoreductase subunit G
VNTEFFFRGEKAEISTFLNKALDNDFIGNVIDVCPVGALTDRTSDLQAEYGLQNQ